MIVEAGGVFYHDVISITQTAPNKVTLVMSEPSTGLSSERSVVVPIFCPIQVMGGIDRKNMNAIMD